MISGSVNYQSLSDAAILQAVVGVREANRIYRGSLSALLYSGAGAGSGTGKLSAVLELVRRGLHEQLRRQPIFVAPQLVRDYLSTLIGHLEHEVFTVLFRDSQHALIVAEEMFRGTVSQTSVYPREVVKTALRHNAAAVILAHNHPSGVAEPSRADEFLTQTLKSALALVDVRVLDHIVVGRGSTVSLAERGLI